MWGRVCFFISEIAILVSKNDKEFCAMSKKKMLIFYPILYLLFTIYLYIIYNCIIIV